MENKLKSKSYFVPLEEGFLHIKRIYSKREEKPVLMLHGSIENGKIFYTRSMKGLAPFLAMQGYDVFVVDMSGRGESMPQVNKNSKNSQTDAVTHEITACRSFVMSLKGKLPQHWIAHSWGGVLMLAHIARYGSEGIASMAFFATKRRITVVHLERLFKVEILIKLISRAIIRLYGYLPAKKLKLGGDDEPKIFYRQMLGWIFQKAWVDEEDGFDYTTVLRQQVIPPTLYLAGKNDTYLGHPVDVNKLKKEVNNPRDEFILLSKEHGNLQDYDHINILTHSDAKKDHFPMVIAWMKKHEK